MSLGFPRTKLRALRAAAVLAGFLVSLSVAANFDAAGAETLRIVALGASNTAGMGRGRHNMGVPRGQAYPAQLERLLRARGIAARVANAGIAGDTTAGMLARLDRAVPRGTHVVILQPGGNDARRGSGADRGANISEIERRLRARGIAVVLLDRMGAGIGRHRLADGQHFSTEGHAAIAARLLPAVLAAIGRQ